MGKFIFKGLSEKEVADSRAKYGSNVLAPPDVESFMDKLKENFEDPLIKILLVALGITLVLAFVGYADWIEGIGIAVAVFLATFVATYSEYKNESSFQELQYKASQIQNTVFRDGHMRQVIVGDIVVGDYVLLEAGDKVPADGCLIDGEIHVGQASLTGEPDAKRKTIAPANFKHPGKTDPDFDDIYACFRGGTVDEGAGVMVVHHVGNQTYYGAFLEELNEDETPETPLQEKLSALADGVSTLGYVGAAFIALSFLFKQFVMDNEYDWVRIVEYASEWQLALKDAVTSLILAIIVIVVAVPEGLPMMIAIVLSLNMRKLLRSNVLVRKLLGIEAAGSLNVLYADKTGTITKGLFVPHSFISGNGDSFKKCGLLPEQLRGLVALALRESVSSIFDKDTGEVAGGNASDRALLMYLDEESRIEKYEVHTKSEQLFNSVRKFSATTVEIAKEGLGPLPNELRFGEGDNKNCMTIVKGAPEIILANATEYVSSDCQLVKETNFSALKRNIDALSNEGIRVIALALSKQPLNPDNEGLPSNLVILGVIGVLDEVRSEASEAITRCRSAGIQVVMITGDRRETAMAVGREIGLLGNEPESGDRVLESKELRQMSDADLTAMLPKLSIIARALPTDKSRVVRLSQKQGKVVGMTGDGVNDSAALKLADVGFAMGSGSEIAKEAGDVVILDDNILSITQAVLYGRTIFKSIRKFVVFQSTVNFASFIPVFLGPFLGFDFPLTLIQLLWVNLVMDTLAALAFGGEAALLSYMTEPPIPRKAAIIDFSMWTSIVMNGLFVGLAAIVFLTWDPVLELFTRNGVPNRLVFLTAFFDFFIFATNFNAFNVRTNKLNLLDHITLNSGFVLVVTLIFGVQVAFTWIGGDLLRTVWLTPGEWGTVTMLSALIIPYDLVRKVILLLAGVGTETGADKKKSE